MIREWISENKEKQVFTKANIEKQKTLLFVIDDCVEFNIINSYDNIASAIMTVVALAENQGESIPSMDFYALTDEELNENDPDNVVRSPLLNTMAYTHYLDLCANVDWLEELKKVLVPMQLKFEAFTLGFDPNAEDEDDVPDSFECSFKAIVKGKEKVFYSDNNKNI